jgi:hypothetical protein
MDVEWFYTFFYTRLASISGTMACRYCTLVCS